VAIASVLEETIARTPSAVFGELSAVERYPEWLTASGIRSVELIDGGPIGDGSRIRLEQEIAGRSTRAEGRVTAFRPGEQFALEASEPQGVTFELDASLAADGPTTRLRWRIRLTLPLRYRLFESMVAPEVRRAAFADLQNLKRRLEAVAG
jgi:hypothetical protein